MIIGTQTQSDKIKEHQTNAYKRRIIEIFVGKPAEGRPDETQEASAKNAPYRNIVKTRAVFIDLWQ
jgi:hypothetical protein